MFDNKFSPPPPLSLPVVSIERNLHRNKKKSHVRLPKLTNHSGVPVASSPLVHCTWTLKTVMSQMTLVRRSLNGDNGCCALSFNRGDQGACWHVRQRWQNSTSSVCLFKGYRTFFFVCLLGVCCHCASLTHCFHYLADKCLTLNK